jgi:hypothetical protein
MGQPLCFQWTGLVIELLSKIEGSGRLGLRFV